MKLWKIVLCLTLIILLVRFWYIALFVFIVFFLYCMIKGYIETYKEMKNKNLQNKLQLEKKKNIEELHSKIKSQSEEEIASSMRQSYTDMIEKVKKVKSVPDRTDIVREYLRIMNNTYSSLSKEENENLWYLWKIIKDKCMELFNDIANFNDISSISKTEKNDDDDDDDDGFYNKFKQCDVIKNKYRSIIGKHFKLIEKIRTDYVIANNSPTKKINIDSVIKLCEEDIDLASEYMEYCKEIAEIWNEPLEKHVPSYYSFQRLAIIFEKQNKINEAIAICDCSINLGFYKDDSSGMIERRTRLIKKSENQLENKIKDFNKFKKDIVFKEINDENIDKLFSNNN